MAKNTAPVTVTAPAIIVPTIAPVEIENSPIIGDAQMNESAPAPVTAPVESAPVESAPAPVTVTLSEIDAYSPVAIDAAIASITSHHATVAAMVKLDPAIVATVRASLGITDNLEADVLKIKNELGGSVAAMIDALKADAVWSNVAEYATMIDNLTMINATRAAMQLPLLTVTVTGARASASTSTSTDVKRSNENSGFMAIGEYAEMKVMEGALTDWSVDADKIVITYNGAEIYRAPQGENTLSAILNTVVRVAVGAGGREGFPAFLRKNNLDPLKIMVAKKPTA